MKYYLPTLVIIFFIFTSSCKKEPIIQKYNLKKGLFITNEGNFTYGNSSLSFIDYEKDTIYNNLFKTATNFPLGDVAQHIAIWEDLAFIVINNSGKIFVIDNTTIEYIATIKNLSSPRQIAIKDNNTAYVSDLYSSYISVIDLNNYKINTTINIGYTSEALLIHENYLYVTNWSYGDKIIKINTSNNKVTSILKIGKQPNSLIIDKENMLWVLSDGGMDSDTSKNAYASLTQIDISNFSILKQLEFPYKSSSPTHLSINNNGDTLYYINSSWNGTEKSGGIFKFCIYENKLPTKPFIPENDHLFYSLNVLEDRKIVVSDAIDFAQKGTVMLFSAKGKKIKSYKAGIIPGYFLFKK